MAQLFALLQSDPQLLRPQLHRLEAAVDLRLRAGKVVGVGYFESGKVLLRKRPVGTQIPTLGQLAQDVRSELFVATSHGPGASGFREDDTQPYRYRNWVFAGTGSVVPLGERAQVLAALPDVLQRAVVGPSDAELAFVVTLAEIQRASRSLDHLDLEPRVASDALSATLKRMDERARTAGVAAPQTCAVMSNGRMLAALRRGRPLYYALLEGIPASALAPADMPASESDPRWGALRRLRGVALATRPLHDGVQWIEVPDNHTFTVGRTLEVRVTAL